MCVEGYIRFQWTDEALFVYPLFFISLGAETADQSCEIKPRDIRTYGLKIF